MKTLKYLLVFFLFSYAFANDDGSYITKFKSDWVLDSVYYYGDECDTTNFLQHWYHQKVGCNKYTWVYGDEYSVSSFGGSKFIVYISDTKYYKNRICKLCHRKERLRKESGFYHELNEYGKLDSMLYDTCKANKK